MLVLRSLKPAWRVALLLAFLTISLPLLSTQGSLRAQAVRYSSVTRGEFGGSLGMMMQMVPGGQDEIRETTFIKGSLMRTDNEESSTIVNMETGDYTFIQHEDKTYYTLNMREMGDRFVAMAEEPEVEEDPGEAEPPEFDVKLTTDRTGRTQRFDGYAAEQLLMTMELIPLSEEARSSVEESGTMVVLTEIWLSEDFPGHEALESVRAEFTQGGISDQGAGGYNAALEQAFASDPRMKEAFERNRAEMADLKGMPVKTVTNMVTVPRGVTFDREAVLAAADRPLETSGSGDLLAQAAGAAASGAAREALGRMGGMLGRRNRQQEEAPPEPAAAQSILMRVTALLEDVQTADVPDSMFQPPEGYEKQEPAWIGGGL